MGAGGGRGEETTLGSLARQDQKQTKQLLEHGPGSVQVLRVLISFCNTVIALTLPTASTKELRKWTILGLEARKGRKWKQRPFVGKGNERRKGRGWGATPISSAPGRSRRFSPGDLPGPKGAVNPGSPSAALHSVHAERRAAAGHRARGGAPHRPSPRPTPPGAGLSGCGHTYLGPVPRRLGRPHPVPPLLKLPRPLLRLLPGPDPSSPLPICH